MRPTNPYNVTPAGVQYDTHKIAAAFVNVTRHLLTDAFSLTSHETMWLQWQLTEHFAALRDLTPVMQPVAVRRELLDYASTRALRNVETGRRQNAPTGYVKGVTTATADEWAGIIVSMLNRSYDLNPIVAAHIRVTLRGTLTELGVGDPKSPRGSASLPQDLKNLISR